MMTSPEGRRQSWHLAAPPGALARDGRVHATIEDRHVTLIRRGRNVFALDSICYHAGGPLGAGNIEDIVVDGESIPCVRCPWHHYLISLIDGEKWYSALERDDSGALVPAGWRSSEERLQRVHDVEERPDGIYVRLRLEGEIRSDNYAFRSDCAAGLSRRRRAGGNDAGADGRRGRAGGNDAGADGRTMQMHAFFVWVATSVDALQQQSCGAGRREFIVGAGAVVAAPTPPGHAYGGENGALDAAVELGALGGTRPYVVHDGRELQSVNPRDAVAMLISADTIWLGEHHEAQNDREMQAGIIAAIAVAKARRNQRPCVGVGLEAVRAEFQPALDAYVAGEFGKNVDALRVAARWDEHWPFPISSYASVLDMCRELGLPLVALGASSDELAAVEKDGLSALDVAGWERLSLPEGAASFASFSSTRAFNRYAHDVLSPSMMEDPAFANQFCSRIVWDESMAARAAEWIEAHHRSDPTLVVLAGAEHVTFGCGAPARCARRLDRTGDRFAAKSVLLNPRPDDFVIPPAGANGPLTLGLKFAADDDQPNTEEAFNMAQVDSRGSTNLPLSDLVWFSPWTPDCV
ncbi:hypothetical protein CTAYLR_007289 [Chrysophaeum taylorii]|uniref:Rieske domain-containing protein n=1 Tax=Chrysophaeum taylorii TaxID=2483200 RepID=A0AAD7XPD3_9STRA|nr:hypothetical protein CTAYLR_007289 [Chrysophaeum taylorii]